MARRAIGGSTPRRNYAADATNAADVCPTSKEEAMLTASDDDDGSDAVEAPALKVRNLDKQVQ